MAAGPWIHTNASKLALLNGGFDLNTDGFTIALFLAAAAFDANSTVYSDVNEHAQAFGYVRPGISLGSLDLTGTSTIKVTDATSIVWTANGGSIIAKYAAIYRTAATQTILCHCLLESGGADVTVTTGNTLTITMHTDGIFTLT
jgi:hypothetical protein